MGDNLNRPDLGVELILYSDINNTPADRAYVAEVAKRIDAVICPEGRDQFARWLEPGGVLRLWEK